MGITFEKLLEYMNMSEEDYEKDLENEANFYVSKNLIVNAIAKKQFITLSNKEYEEYLSDISDTYEDFNSTDELEEYTNSIKTEEQLRNDALAEKVIDYLLKYNHIEENIEEIEYESAFVNVE